jgi:hypothetical protein
VKDTFTPHLRFRIEPPLPADGNGKMVWHAWHFKLAFSTLAFSTLLFQSWR